jgi:hypothetical protein
MRLIIITAPMDPDLKEKVAAWASDNPDGAAALRAEGAAQERARLESAHREALAAATADGARMERERVASIRAVVPPGFEALAEKLVAEGSTADQAAHAVCAAVREQGVAAARANAAGVIPPLTFVASTTSEEEAKAKDPDSIDPKELARRIREIQAANPSMNTLAAAAEARKSLYGV